VIKIKLLKNTKKNRTSFVGGVHPGNKLNVLSGEQWLYFTKSVITTTYPSEYNHELRKAHGANKPPQLMRELIEFFTRPGEIVLDPFAGVGGTLIGASICDRRAIGIEINKKWVDIYHQVCKQEKMRPQRMIRGDCLKHMDKLMKDYRGKIAFIATDPPYNLNFERTMCVPGKYEEFNNRHTDFLEFSDLPRDFSNLSTYDEYLDKMEEAFGKMIELLGERRYMTLIVRNAYQDSHYIMTHSDLANRAQKAGFVLKGEKIWYQAGTRLRPYGYPHAYVPNIAHQYILFFRKEDTSEKRIKLHTT